MKLDAANHWPAARSDLAGFLSLYLRKSEVSENRGKKHKIKSPRSLMPNVNMSRSNKLDEYVFKKFKYVFFTFPSYR